MEKKQNITFLFDILQVRELAKLALLSNENWCKQIDFINLAKKIWEEKWEGWLMKPIWFLTKFQSPVKQPQVARLFATLASWTLRTQNLKKKSRFKDQIPKMKVLLCGNLPCFPFSVLKTVCLFYHRAPFFISFCVTVCGLLLCLFLLLLWLYEIYHEVKRCFYYLLNGMFESPSLKADGWPIFTPLKNFTYNETNKI